MMTEPIKTVLTQQAAGTPKNTPLDIRQALQAMADKKTEEQQDSTKVTLSELGRLQVKTLQMQPSVNSVSEARKSAARAHAAQLKQQIEALKKIAVMLGPMASKTLLRQIKHLAQQVRQIAAELAQSSSASTIGNPNAVASNVMMDGGDLSVDANVDFGLSEEAENGDEKSVTEEDMEREAATAQAETPEAEIAEAEGDEEAAAAGAAVAQAEQAAYAAEKEIKAQENEKTTGIGGNTGLAAKSSDEARQRQEDALLMRDLVKELRLLLSLAKGMLLKKDKEDKENLKEIDKQLAAADDLVQELEAAAQSTVEAETVAVGAVDAAAGDAAASLSVFA
ncbi:MAG: hypothetical protein LBJ59_05530 [Zoogloeaceae bacterium]|nr:hypothetical protein [Zoogloeaceae bacterium]